MTKSGPRKSSSAKPSTSEPKKEKRSSRRSTKEESESKKKGRSSRAKADKPDSKQTPSPQGDAQQGGAKRTSPLVVALGIIAIVALGSIYLITGVDALGLFEPSPTPIVEVTTQAPTATALVSNPTTQPSSPTSTAALTPRPTRRPRTSWWEVYFTDPQTLNDPNHLEGSIPEKLIEYIDEAESSIHIASFEFNLAPVADALIKAQERGVEVQWVTDDEYGIEEDKANGLRLFPKMEKAGIKVRDDGRTALMHNKFWIFDEETVWTGSTNITENGAFRNNNNVLVIDSPDVAAIYETEFTEMWRKDYGPTSPSSVRLQETMVNRTPVQVLFAPEDKVIDRLIPLIEGAQESIYFMAFSFTHEGLGAAMRDRAEEGVPVAGIFETRGSETEYSQLAALHCALALVRQDGNPGALHHKVIVIDGETVITGSLNFSANADESNDENVIVIQSKSIANEYMREFDYRWAEGHDPDPAEFKCPN